MSKMTRCLMLGTALCLTISACDGTGKKVGDLLHHRPRTTLALVDTSGSIAPEDRPIYVGSLGAVANTLQAGDRLVVAEIGDGDRGAFRAALDVTVPDSDVRLDREEAVSAARAEVNKTVPTLVPEGAKRGARSTLILAAIAAGAQAFGNGPHEGDRLIILSDGVEEGPVINLTRVKADPADISAALDKARKAGLLPALDGVQITFAGAGGANYVAVEQFWRAYAAATHANLLAYGRLPFRPAA